MLTSNKASKFSLKVSNFNKTQRCINNNFFYYYYYYYNNKNQNFTAQEMISNIQGLWKMLLILINK